MNGLAIFGSTHQVLKAERVLEELGYSVKMVPMPPEISADCGVALRFEPDQTQDIVAAVEAAGLTIRSIHTLER